MGKTLGCSYCWKSGTTTLFFRGGGEGVVVAASLGK